MFRLSFAINSSQCFDKFIASSIIEFPEHIIETNSSQQKPFNMFRLSYATPSSRCFDKFTY